MKGPAWRRPVHGTSAAAIGHGRRSSNHRRRIRLHDRSIGRDIIGLLALLYLDSGQLGEEGVGDYSAVLAAIALGMSCAYAKGKHGSGGQKHRLHRYILCIRHARRPRGPLERCRCMAREAWLRLKTVLVL